MQLHTSGASPFGRKVKVVAIETGLLDRLEIVNHGPLSPIAANADIVARNPLGKVPCLVTDDGTALFDSRVICEYLDAAGGGRLFPPAGAARWRALRDQAQADGIMDAAVGTRYELNLRPEGMRWRDWSDGQMAKVQRSLDGFERDAAELAGRVDIGTLTLGCALGYLDFRFAEVDWRRDRGGLAAWFEGLAERPSFQQTVPK